MSLLKKLFHHNSTKYSKHNHWYYLAPALILMVLFNFYPLVKTLFISLDSRYNKFADTFSYSFNFSNYTTTFCDPDFRTALFNTFLLVFVAVPISIFLSLMIALALNSVYNRFLKNIFQTIFFLPYLTNTVIMGIVFAVLFYHNSFGIQTRPEGFFNSFFGFQQDWINISAPYSYKMFVLIFYVVWKSLPFQILIFSVGLKNISKDYYDAARIDGASKITIFRKITLPLLAPTIFYQFIIAIIQVFKEYESVIGVFGNSYITKVNTVVGYIYQQLEGTLMDSYSRGAAATVILLLISILFTAINFFFFEKKLNE
ncbi:carbohydrate ABC transporter permease [Candidatus Phytoplasma asteris]|uniref:carbohydrate ABC transporter permease n=1 Tax=Candidatus Phytoplasma asteris TaxID=85620 RepID=UPI0039DF8161